MNINDIFRKIESHETSAQLNLTSNLRHFFMYAERVECIQELKNALKDTICITETLKRILSLSKEDIDFRYENPYDSAITIYLWVLFLQSEIAGKVAANIASKLRHGWWAPRYARKVLKEDVYFTPTTIEEVGEEREYSFHASDSQEMYFQFGVEKDVHTEVDWGIATSRYIPCTNLNDPCGPSRKALFASLEGIEEIEASQVKSMIIKTDFGYLPIPEKGSHHNFLDIRYNYND